MHVLRWLLPAVLSAGLVAVFLHRKPAETGPAEGSARESAPRELELPDPATQDEEGPLLEWAGDSDLSPSTVYPEDESASSANDDEADLEKPLVGVFVEGNQQRNSSEILELVRTRAGEVANPARIRNDIRNLSTTGWFSHVEVRICNAKGRQGSQRQGRVLVFKVVEKPALERVAFIGNRTQTDASLLEATRLRGPPIGQCQVDCGGQRSPTTPPSPPYKGGEATRLTFIGGLTVRAGYDVNTNREAARRLTQHYHNLGYVHARVTLEKGGSPDEREVVFRIDEGPRVVVTKIEFEGNASFPDSVLKLALISGTPILWSEDGIFNQKRAKDDVHRLKVFYHSHGFFDVRLDQRIRFSDDGSQVAIAFVVDEGERFKVRRIGFEGNRLLSQDELRVGARVRENDFYDQRLAQADCDTIVDRYFQSGRIFAAVEPKPRFVEEPGIVDLKYVVVDEGAAYKIDIPTTSTETRASAATPALAATVESQPGKKPVSEPAGLRDLDRLVFEGVEPAVAAAIRQTLAFDFDHFLAAHPQNGLDDYLTTLAALVQTGFRYSGFPEAEVTAAFDEATQRIVVRVTAGPSYLCGDVEVDGAESVSTARLASALTENPKPRLILWRKGEPAPFDDYTSGWIRRRLAGELAAAGYLSPNFEITRNPQPDGKTVNLKVRIASEGPRATVGQIVVTGAKRDSEADVLKYLDAQPGMPYDADLPDRLNFRLWESGAFWSSNVVAVVPAGSDENGPVQDLHVKLSECEIARPLAAELLPAEQALFRMRTWLDRWDEGDVEEDLVVTAAFAREAPEEAISPAEDRQPVAASPFETNLTLRAVIAPDRGQTVSVRATQPDGNVLADVLFVAYPEKFVLAARQRNRKIEFPNSTERRLILNAESKAVQPRHADDPRFRFSFGVGVNSRAKPKPMAFAVKLRLDPVCVTSIIRDEKSRSRFRDGIWEIRNEGLELRVDDATGRPVEFHFHEPGSEFRVTIRAEKNALAAELRELEPAIASATNDYDRQSPCKSVLEFFIEEWLYGVRRQGMEQGIEPVQALRKFVSVWSPPGLASLFEPLNPLLVDNDVKFGFPTHPAGFTFDGLQTRGSRSHKNMAGLLLPIYRRLVPKTGWFWPAGRDNFLAWGASDGPAADLCVARLQSLLESPELGPLGELAIGLGNCGGHAAVGESAGRNGLRRLASTAFANDCRPLLTGDGWLSEWLLSLAEALRQLDESELWALARLFPEDEETACDALAESLSLLVSHADLKSHAGESVKQVLPAVLDALWVAILHGQTRLALWGLANVNALMPVDPPDFQPVLFEESPGDPPVDDEETESGPEADESGTP